VALQVRKQFMKVPLALLKFLQSYGTPGFDAHGEDHLGDF
jgi:hypothetical protein